eukprot:9495592-Pyramimonas_sp.AAC.1
MPCHADIRWLLMLGLARGLVVRAWERADVFSSSLCSRLLVFRSRSAVGYLQRARADVPVISALLC